MMKKTTAILGGSILALSLATGAAFANTNAHKAPMKKLVAPHVMQKLQLTPQQQKKWDQINSQRNTITQTLNTDRQQIRTLVNQEAASSNPDLSKVFAQQNKMRQTVSDKLQTIQKQQQDFLASLTPAQKITIVKKMQKRMNKMDQLQSQMRKSNQAQN